MDVHACGAASRFYLVVRRARSGAGNSSLTELARASWRSATRPFNVATRDQPGG